MEKKRIRIVYKKDGSRVVEAIGFNGQGSKEATEAIESLLGDTTDVEYKAEWWALNGESVQHGLDEFNIDSSNLCG